MLERFKSMWDFHLYRTAAATLRVGLVRRQLGQYAQSHTGLDREKGFDGNKVYNMPLTNYIELALTKLYSAVVFAPEMDGPHRFLVEYRKRNTIVVLELYP